jgi:dihydroorotate dehydrogenase (NAD+) catalytic subunit
LVGASAVQVGTANYIDPTAGVKIAAGMARYCEENQIEDVGSLVGTMKEGSAVSVIQSWL